MPRHLYPDFREAILISSGSRRGLAHADGKKDYERAILDFTKAIQFDPKFTLAYVNRARVYDKMSEKEKAKADREQADRLEGTPVAPAKRPSP